MTPNRQIGHSPITFSDEIFLSVDMSQTKAIGLQVTISIVFSLASSLQSLRQINYPVEESPSKGRSTDTIGTDLTMHQNARALDNTFKYQKKILNFGIFTAVSTKFICFQFIPTFLWMNFHEYGSHTGEKLCLNACNFLLLSSSVLCLSRKNWLPRVWKQECVILNPPVVWRVHQLPGQCSPKEISHVLLRTVAAIYIH